MTWLIIVGIVVYALMAWFTLRRILAFELRYYGKVTTGDMFICTCAALVWPITLPVLVKQTGIDWTAIAERITR